MDSKIDYFIYIRKSTDEPDRQVQSVESQHSVLLQLAQNLNLNVIHTFIERKSAKAPGRPEFGEMMQKIRAGNAKGILTWKLDRLARNPVDAGTVQWLLQQEDLRSIRTPEREYLPKDNALLTSVEFGMSNQYVRDLSDNVKRGLMDKARKGWRPGTPPRGYLNSNRHVKGEETILTHPDIFPLIRKLYDLKQTVRN